MYAPPVWLTAVEAVVTALAVGGAVYVWRARDRRRSAFAAIASLAAFLIWRVALTIANGANLDIDYDGLLGLSFEDIGTGVLSFLFTALALGFGIDRAERADRLVRTAGVAGIVAMLVDRFV